MEMTLFWILAGVIALGVGGILVLALLRGGTGAEPAAACDLRVYRDQLREIDRDQGRGTIGPDEAERLRAEVSRRLLDADRALKAEAAATRAPRIATLAAAGAVLLLVGGAVAAYLGLGTPGQPDQPMAARLAQAEDAYRNRPSQAEAEAAMAGVPRSGLPQPDQQFLDLMEKLRTAVARNPDDIRGQELLVRNEAALGNYAAAAKAQEKVIALLQPKAGAEDHAGLAELMIMAAGGIVSPEAEARLTEALRLDPQNGTARYYSGLLLAQTGRPDMAFRLWRALLEGSAPDAPWVPPLRAQIGQLAWLAGVEYEVPPAPDAGPAPGPTQGDMEAAQEMSPEDRQAMIRSMVEGLNQRLATEGGSADEWARLIGALAVLGEADRARAIYDEALGRFAGRDADLAAIRAAGEKAGVAP
ncbi:c-type cytochrome biogenesis protein CcmI [Cereibacter sphaeroides]|uniref:c-type cytochrome biogenesis protein CcmI n=1 Tax=Cereibacter sphaeroides TaxID=1063 RepID=UPI001F2B8C86|nr:c-type cytochrome biogenesis protein CcmI [Cereibacter sphaeroides]MCE6961685.1 c-type cytochrome biogenesis protein CcmI [Cereibacter sphaeroides]MCE6970461.1 c-type cytochrome biogenesis protein CcmI [Cereibacter sphaeroides]MCE6975035.1 c-type cytochrome biogenesis protein CcmI [Cereibacter sphaeroides]